MRNISASGNSGKWLLLLALLATLSAVPARAYSQGRVSISVGFGGFFGIPAYVGYGGYYYPTAYPPGYYAPPMSRPYYAFVDTDIHPEEASVYLDGKLIGIADDFDGYPGYLALKPGHHTLAFLRPGYHSLSFKLDLHPGEMIDLDRKLARLAAGESEEPPPSLPPKADSQQAPAPQPAGEEGGKPQRGIFGTLRLEVTPAEARVVLDGDFFGTGGEISRLHGGIPLSPGTHRIRVSLSGYKSSAVETEIQESEQRDVRISLKKL
jgi:hypothetical protein